ncbi:TPA: hypothetical protein PWU90_000795 [Mannheimia haemolytica]|uniref:hypothetical protein n=1 Tax=Mannheimia haemolytica TaxID=75985 RepID=UPI000517F5A5|nr:hypothetical protein [Mannheimia haemolytica]KYL10072.1 hypothetical protein AC568_04530 [Mannheimia haemolytica]MDW0618349.1 hypothetical protein [Mannheimia haemolytica]MDW0624107.1 hypothetical protein [Mannheimia haemolytica]MEE3701288.1 hypothetical protein [Mannheimia haemolytica]NBB66940.1 hypothetical protein [Mannheimia haemolytica]
MSKQLHYRHKSRWHRLNRLKKMNKRRLNLFLQEKRVANLESRLADEVELAKLNSEQIGDLLQALELKVNRLIRQNEKLKARVIKLEKVKQTQKQGLFAMFKKVLGSKGNP